MMAIVAMGAAPDSVDPADTPTENTMIIWNSV